MKEQKRVNLEQSDTYIVIQTNGRRRSFSVFICPVVFEKMEFLIAIDFFEAMRTNENGHTRKTSK